MRAKLSVLPTPLCSEVTDSTGTLKIRLAVHARTASLIFKVPVESVTSQQRGVGKTLNFALIYRQGAFATGQSLGVSTKEAQGFIEKYFESFPKVKAFMNRIISDARSNGYVQTLWGRRRY